MRNILLILLTLTFSFATSQITTRTIEVKSGQMEKFIEMAGKKTKKFNNEEGAARFWTYEILTGSDAGKIWRMRGSDAEYMDNWDANSEESNYWQKNVGPYIANGSVNGMYMWNYVGEMSHNVDSKNQNHVMGLVYKFKDSGEQDFWRFRERIVAARKAMDTQPKGSMHSIICTSGCNGNTALILFEYESYSDQQSYNQEMLPKMIEKYNELYGNDAYEQDGSKVDNALVENGRGRLHLRFIPEASSN
ncbi:MAG: hypothetical protein P8N64_05160 [Flavobacteriaceae bacterium]|nr:hypothetical protein [Flavobacteriaceae bacterium]|tara:strand:+ start:149 stop:892 length:744 start_codon:yes stop_codon:yes gene_type:complete